MTITFDKKNKWCIIINTIDNKKHYIAIPPTNDDRIDILNLNNMLKGYNYNVDVLIITIKKGVPTISYLKDNNLIQIKKK